MIAWFRIGDVFPADDPVARFVITFAMFANDLFRSTAMFGRLDDETIEDMGRRLMLVRYQASLFHEVVTFIRDARRVPAVEAFVVSLEADAPGQLATMQDAAHELGPWLENHRNLTFHYAEMHPARIAAGRDDLMRALADAADERSMIEAVEGDRLGFPFADQVVVQLLPEDLRTGSQVLVRGVAAATALSMAAVRKHISAQDEASFVITAGPDID